ncbi:monoacylglycerol lipase ABHD12-like [Ostrinia furnacalis]|uniref:monoacylglycerol lipase ABHD12-like n=1 Tax=Ostrinia furnacalis TaxID=93504 RepID=UPI00104015AC|nr:monoacylglycerol lipase ABHD12-like [Ostrinia furnacalis]XP_028178283.1 monoacylglycerol lipase ABHD12-like [Ostrinia furnacalis]
MVVLQGILVCLPLYTFGALMLGAAISAGLFVFHVAVVPMIFKYSKTFRRHLIFANFVQWPLYIDHEEPSTRGIDGGRNISIEYHSKVDNCNVKIGIWHILPRSVYERLKGSFECGGDKEDLNKLLDEELATSKMPIMIYCHGNSNSRAATHRIQLYRFFQQMDFHTIAFDYRGYGDSTNLNPSEDGVVEDSLVVYEWLHNTLEKAKDKPAIFVWGHSLGTGISSHLLGNLDELSVKVLDRAKPLPMPKGLILESPFNNLAEEVAEIPISKLVTWLPYFDAAFVKPFRAAPEHSFRSEEHLARVPALPILILHAKDDVIVPFVVGVRLFKSIVASRSLGGATVKLHAYDKSQGLGHKWICHAEDLPEVVGEFVKNHQ